MDAPEFVLANKRKFDRNEALELMGEAQEIWVAKGKKLLRFKSATAHQEELADAILGRSGTLRAPAIRVQDTFLVGFHAEGYAEIFDE